MKVLVGYESRGGTTRRTAEAIGEAARAEGHDVTVKPIREIRAAEAQAADVLFAGSWVKGFVLFGVGPSPHAIRAIRRLDLTGKRAAAFCTYHVHPKGTLDKLRAALAAQGAVAVGERAFHHNAATDGAGKFTRDVLATVNA
jgi:flavodoxin